MNKRNFITSWVVMAFFAFFYFNSLSLAGSAAYWPKLVCIIGIVLSALSALSAGFKWKKEKDGEAVLPLSRAQMKRAFILLLVMVLWLLGMTRLGYLVSSIIATGAIVLIFEPVKDKKNIIRDIVTALIFSASMFEVFTLLGVHFPSGLLR